MLWLLLVCVLMCWLVILVLDGCCGNVAVFRTGIFIPAEDTKYGACICVILLSLFLPILSFTDNSFTNTELGVGGSGAELLMDIAFLWTKSRFWYKVTNIITMINNNTISDNVRALWSYSSRISDLFTLRCALEIRYNIPQEKLI